MSSKSVYRAVRQLEQMGWLEVARRRERSNHYRMSWPPGRKPPETVAEQGDKNVIGKGQDCSLEQDKNDRQTYLTNQPKTFSRRLGGGRQTGWFRDRGKYEMRIIDRYGVDMIEVMQKLEEFAPAAVNELCRGEQAGTLTIADVNAARLLVIKQNRANHEQ